MMRFECEKRITDNASSGVEMHALGSPLQNRLFEQIRDHLGGSVAIGDRINEAELAGRFGVSRTPVRHVLKRLESDGVVSYEHSRGFRLIKLVPASAAGSAEVETGLLDKHVLRDMALGAFSGAVSERSLLQRYDVSRRELLSTLRSLTRDGLVDPSPGQGWIFADISSEALRKSYDFRKIVEPAGILADGFDLDRQRLDAIEAAHRRALDELEGMDGPALFDLDARFHHVVASFSGTGFLEEAIDRQNTIRRVAEYAASVRKERMGQSMREHLDIIAALKAGDRQHAAALMHVHLKLSAAETFIHLEADLDTVRAGGVDLEAGRKGGAEAGADGSDPSEGAAG